MICILDILIKTLVLLDQVNEAFSFIYIQAVQKLANNKKSVKLIILELENILNVKAAFQWNTYVLGLHFLIKFFNATFYNEKYSTVSNIMKKFFPSEHNCYLQKLFTFGI